MKLLYISRNKFFIVLLLITGVVFWCGLCLALQSDCCFPLWRAVSFSSLNHHHHQKLKVLQDSLCCGSCRTLLSLFSFSERDFSLLKVRKSGKMDKFQKVLDYFTKHWKVLGYSTVSLLTVGLEQICGVQVSLQFCFWEHAVWFFLPISTCLHPLAARLHGECPDMASGDRQVLSGEASPTRCWESLSLLVPALADDSQSLSGPGHLDSGGPARRKLL